MDINISNIVKVDTSLNLAKIIKNNVCVVIKISACWCGPCKNIQFINLYNNLKYIYINNNNIKFLELDIDNDSDIIDNKDFFDINIKSVPTFLVAINGNFTNSFSGTSHIEDINKILSKITN